MTTTVLRPNSNSGAATGVTIVPSGTADGVVSDDSDSTYLQYSAPAESYLFGLTTKSLAAGEITKSFRLRTRLSTATPDDGTCVVEVRTQPSGGSSALITTSALNPSASISTFTDPALPTSLSQSQVDGLQLKVFPLDSADAFRLYELYLDLVTVAKPVATVTAVSPDPYTASSTVPISWTRTLDSDGGAQTRYQVQVTDDDDGDAVVFDSGEVLGSGLSATVGPLVDGNYTVKVRVAQTVNGASHWSDYATDSFAVAVSSSDVSTVVGTADNANGAIDVVVTRDGASNAWELIEVERSFDAGLSWTPVRTATLVDSTGDANTFSVTDYEAPNGQATVYRARATLYNLGAPITGPWTEAASTSWTSTVNWLKSPLAPSLNSAVKITRWPTQSRNSRAGVFYPIGSSQPVVVSDVLTSSTGSVTFKVTGSAEMLALDALLADSSTLILNLVPASLTGPDRNGFQYVNPISVTESWLTRNYRDASGDKEIRLVTVNFVTSSRPPDATAGTL